MRSLANSFSKFCKLWQTRSAAVARTTSHSPEFRRTSPTFTRVLVKSNCSNVHAQYDWTTGMPDNGNEWRKFRVVPRLCPFASPLVLYTFITGGGNRMAFTLPVEGRDHFHCTVEPSPGHIRCRYLQGSWEWRVVTQKRLKI